MRRVAQHHMSTHFVDKAALRRTLLALRNAMPPQEKEEADAAIAAGVRHWLSDKSVAILGVYWPLRGEPDLRPLYEELRAQGIRLALPVVVQSGAPLLYAAWMPGDALEKDAGGVPAPVSREAVDPDCLLVPCVGFTAGNLRLGYGGGFYDRTLAARPGVRAAGIAYRRTASEFPAGPHDLALDAIITETSPV